MFESFIMGLWYWHTRGLRFGDTMSSMLFQPVFVGLIGGILYGNIESGMKIGAAIQLLYLGVTSTPGGNVPVDPAMASCVAIPIALQTGMEPTLAVTLAIPFGVLGTFLEQLKKTVNTFFVHNADRYAEKGDVKGIYLNAYILPAIYEIFVRIPPIFLATYYGEDLIIPFLNSIPEWMLHGFNVLGGILPALGFATTIFVIGKKKLLPFFILGFFMVKYLKIDVMGVTIFGVCISCIFNYLIELNKKEAE